MSPNLFEAVWNELDPIEVRIVIHDHVDGIGQVSENARGVWLPEAGDGCAVILSYSRFGKLTGIEPGPAFDAAWWATAARAVSDLTSGRTLYAAEVTFSTRAVKSVWAGSRSEVQISPMPVEAPQPGVELADHPFVLEFPVIEHPSERVRAYRRLEGHRRLSRILNLLLTARISSPGRSARHLWAYVDQSQTKWVQTGYFAPLGRAILSEEKSVIDASTIKSISLSDYYREWSTEAPHDELSVPDDLDDCLIAYASLSSATRGRLNRASYWLEVATSLWPVSLSGSFGALVTAVESMTERGDQHIFNCVICGGDCRHEVPGATEAFRQFVEQHAPNTSPFRRNQMYELRSRMLHGDYILEFDRGLPLDVIGVWVDEDQLLRELWQVARVAIRHWLRDVSGLPQ